MTETSTRTNSHARTVRQRFLRDIILLVVLTAVAAWGIGYYQDSTIRRELSRSLVQRIADQAVGQYAQVYQPVEQFLTLAAEWGRSGLLDVTRTADLNAKFIPLIQQLAPIQSVIIAADDGTEYFLQRHQESWLTRLRRQEQEGVRFVWQRWQAVGQSSAQWTEDLDYDPRQRPWFQGAVDQEASGEIFWTTPYTFFTLKTVGITGALRYRTEHDARSYFVVAIDVTLQNIYETVTAIQVSPHGRAFLCTSDHYLGVNSPPAAGQKQVAGAGSYRLTAVAESGDTLPAKAILAWQALEPGQSASFAFRNNGERWWAGFHPLQTVRGNLWLGVAAPEQDFLNEIKGRRQQVFVFALAVVALGGLAAIFLFRRYSRQFKREVVGVLGRRDTEAALHALIASGETARVEFKSTLRINLKTGKKGKEIELAWLKSVVAFLNSQGGVLLIGVDDRGMPLGLEADRFDNEDKCRLHFKNLLKQHIGLEFTKHIQFDIIDYRGQRVLIVECAPSREPVFLIEPRDEAFYIRSGPSSVKLSSRQVLQYLKRR